MTAVLLMKKWVQQPWVVGRKRLPVLQGFLCL